MDEALLAMAMTPSRFPRRADYHRVAEELAEARLQYHRRGWLARPTAYHRAPPPLPDGDVASGRGWANGQRYERITWDSLFTARPEEPGAARWMAHEPNRRATAAVLRAGSDPAPWVIAVHGFCMGFPFMDFVGLQTAQLHGRLGYNLALPALPLHGPRKVTRISGEPFLSFDLMHTVHGLAQAVWDIRRLLTWVRAQGATSVTLYGVSLGAYVVALLAGLERADAVVAGVPVVDFPRLFEEHSPLHIRARAIEHRILGGTAEEVFTVVSPLSFVPQVPEGQRFVYAGYGDRLAFPDQARRLWEHWDRPAIRWYSGNHVGYLWSRDVTQFLEESLGSPPPSGVETKVLAPGA
jgi:dienelactone hydrolase